MKTYKYHIYHDLQINTTSERLFEAVSIPSELEKWWPLHCTGIEEKHATYNFNFTEVYNWYGNVINYDPNVAFHIQMTESNEDWNSTIFGFDIEELDQEKVKLHFWHKNWQQCNEEFKQASFCWAMLLNGLKNYVEKGIIIPFEKRE